MHIIHAFCTGGAHINKLRRFLPRRLSKKRTDFIYTLKIFYLVVPVSHICSCDQRLVVKFELSKDLISVFFGFV